MATLPSSVELLRGPASDAYTQNPRDLARTVQGALGALQGRDGSVQIYHSLQHEDPGKAIVAVVWRPETMNKPALRELANTFFESPSQTQSLHFVPEIDPVRTLSAPTTEIAMWRVHEPANKQLAVESMNSVLRFLSTLPESTGFVELTRGTIAGEDRPIQLLGWESVDAHMDAIQRYPDAMEQVGECLRLASLEIWHAHFQRV